GGAQNSLGGGGRYNSLLKSLGGPDLPGIGFACGLERILQTMIEEEVYFPEKEGPFLYIIPIGEDAKDFAILLAKDLRHHKISVDIDLNAKKIQKSLSLADKLNAKNALILADDEMQKKVASFKNLDKREQQEIKFEDLKNFIRDKFYKL
ncbi:MAG: hypothetical protein K940chlam4_00781, partial [Candidatus Anoxychlamydiales bacterium]|nr:hypothetical protein [Candidatus Anoxychlamydiales bacterium]